MRWWPRRRPDHLDLRVRLLRLEDLFAEPELDPFLPEHAPYDERTGVEQLLGRLRPSKRKATASVTVELAEGADDPGARSGPAPRWTATAGARCGCSTRRWS